MHTKKAAVVKFEIDNIMGGRLSAYLLLLHKKAGIADSWSTLTATGLNTRALVQIQHLFIYLQHALTNYKG